MELGLKTEIIKLRRVMALPYNDSKDIEYVFYFESYYIYILMYYFINNSAVFKRLKRKHLRDSKFIPFLDYFEKFWLTGYFKPSNWSIFK